MAASNLESLDFLLMVDGVVRSALGFHHGAGDLKGRKQADHGELGRILLLLGLIE